MSTRFLYITETEHKYDVVSADCPKKVLLL